MNIWLLTGGVLSAVAGALHLGCIVGGAAWYRFFGAGEHLVRLAEAGRPMPHVYAGGISAALFLAAAYAFSGAGLIGRLPLLRLALVSITAVYLARAAALPLMLRYAQDATRTPEFLLWSSAIVLAFGLVHAIGLATAWASLKV
jgi:hypothetical protein